MLLIACIMLSLRGILQQPGDCYCKINVGGPSCDRCKAGFFNLTSDNVDGCQGL